MAAAAPSRRATAGLAVFVIALLACLAALFDRTWRFGEVFSPADAVFTAYPWAYDTARPIPSNLTRTDEAYFHQPLMETHWARLRRGDFPEWDPTVLSGTPAFFQGLNTGMAFNPLSLPFYLFPADVAVTIYAPLRLLVAGLGMWLYLRHRRASRAAAAAGAFAFAFNGAFIVWLSAPMPTVALWLPWILLAIDHAAARPGWRTAAWLALPVGCMLLGAYLPTSLVVFAAIGAYGIAACASRAMRPSSGSLPVSPGGGPHGSTAAAPRVALRSALALGLGVVGGLLLAAVGLVPMLSTLRGSPAAARSVSASTLPWHNLATLALPDFWGTPLAQNWWFAGAGNYPEFVTYLGVATMMLAAGGLVAAARARDARSLSLAVVALLGGLAMYGVPPATWLGLLPGFRQMNPYRWNVAIACATAVLAARGVDALRAREWSPDARASSPWWALGAMALLGGALAAIAGVVLWLRLDDIRRLALQSFERRQIVIFAATAGATLAVGAWLAWRSARVRRDTHASAAGTGAARTGVPGDTPIAATSWTSTLPACALAAIVAADLLRFAHGFNTTLPRDRYYPEVAGIAQARAAAAGGRVAPVARGAEFVQGHVWSLFGIDVVTGFDFFGDARYQRFMDQVAGRPGQGARWDYVGLEAADLRLLGLLNVTAVVTPPLCGETAGVGYSTVGELTDGRRVSQAFEIGVEGFRAIDVLTATYRRANRGTVTLTLRGPGGGIVATKTVMATDVPETAWLRLEFPPQPHRPGAWRLDLEAHGASEGHAVTLWATAEPVAGTAALTIDGAPDPRALWYRAFAADPARVPGGTLVWSGDLNVYRNDSALPRAFFVSRADVVPIEAHLAQIAASSFDLRQQALLARPLGIAPTAAARVRSIDASRPDERRVEVEAPEGGVLVFAERHASGWSADVDGVSTPVVPADHLLLAIGVPAHARTVRLVYDTPGSTVAVCLSSLALAGIALALSLCGRGHRW